MGLNAQRAQVLRDCIVPGNDVETAHNLRVLIEQIEQGEVDAINPAHYKSHPSGIEAIVVCEHLSFCLGNAMKYVWRAGLKPGEDAVQDLKKAAWYLNREIARLAPTKP